MALMEILKPEEYTLYTATLYMYEWHEICRMPIEE